MSATIHAGDALTVLRTLPAQSVQCCVTSPPYWGLRDYGHDGQLGLEATPEEYVAGMVQVFAEVRRVLRDDGVLWLNLGDSYAGSSSTGGTDVSGLTDGFDNGGTRTPTDAHNHKRPKGHGLKAKDLVGIPWRVAFALQADGWYLRSDVIWAKPNPMPESVTDRPTKAHEYLFLMSKRARYFYDAEAIREDATATARPETSKAHKGTKHEAVQTTAYGSTLGWNRPELGRNRRSVWTIPTQPYPGAHFAVMPPALVEPCVKAGSAIGDTVLDPFAGAGTVGVVARRLRRSFVGIELNPEYARMAERRIESDAPMFNRASEAWTGCHEH